MLELIKIYGVLIAFAGGLSGFFVWCLVKFSDEDAMKLSDEEESKTTENYE